MWRWSGYVATEIATRRLTRRGRRARRGATWRDVWRDVRDVLRDVRDVRYVKSTAKQNKLCFYIFFHKSNKNPIVLQLFIGSV